ncbi:MAG: phage terminase small subunit P27 family [gamma proteobacterium symbiont of Bathyaustriella thionipta]|nr:phage terminase small subunit P27 family [gamma proteobacterium symbiont of Bathyaustriella thionipta]
MTKPTALKMLEGNPGKRPLNQNEPKPEIESQPPAPPAFLDKAAAAKWVELADILHPLGLLTAADHDALSRYCTSWAQWLIAQHELQKEGLTAEAANGLTHQSPHFHISNKSVGVNILFA